MSDQMLSLLVNIKTAKEEIERLQSIREDSQGESERLRAEVERLKKEFRYLTEILSDGDWNEAIIMRVVYRALEGEE